jgi:hypothetical protein
MRFLSSIMSILFFLGACGTSGEKGTPDSLSQDRAAFDLLPDAPDGTPDQASTPGLRRGQTLSLFLFLV